MKVFYKIFLAIILIGIIIFGVGLIMGNGKFDFNGMINNDASYEKQRHQLQSTTNKVEINVDNRHIEVYQTNEMVSYLEYYVRQKTDKVKIEESNDELFFQIKHKNYGLFNIDFSSKNVRTVKVYLRDKEELVINVASGSIAYDYNEAINNLTLKSVSGEVSILTANVMNAIDVKIESGKFVGNNINANSLDVKTTSGKIILKESEVEIVNLHSTSGSVEVEELEARNLDISITSGGLKIINADVDKVKAKTVSGSVKITDKRNKNEIAFNLSSLTGGINFYGERRKEVKDRFEGFKYSYEISVTSGSISINQ